MDIVEDSALNLWMGKIKGIIRVRCVETSMLHLTVNIKGVSKISPPPHPHPQPLPWRWGMRSEEKLFAKWFEIMPNFRKVIVFSLTRETCTNMGTEILPPPPPLSWVQTFPPSSCHLKIRLVRPSLTFLGHHTLLIWQDWLVFTAVFSVTSIYLENATTHTPLSTKFPPWLGSIANIVQQPKYNYHAKFGAFTPKCTIFSPYGLTIWKTHK